MERPLVSTASQVTRINVAKTRTLAELCSHADIVLVDNSFLAPLVNDLGIKKDFAHLIEWVARERNQRTMDLVESRVELFLPEVTALLQAKPAYMVTSGLFELDGAIDFLRENYAGANNMAITNGVRALWTRGQRIKLRVCSHMRACRQIFEKNLEYHTSVDGSPMPPWFREHGEVFSNLELYAALQGMVRSYTPGNGGGECSDVDKEFVVAMFYLSALQGKKVVGLTNDRHIKDRFRYSAAQTHSRDLLRYTDNPEVVEALREARADLISAYFCRENFNFYHPNATGKVH